MASLAGDHFAAILVPFFAATDNMGDQRSTDIDEEVRLAQNLSAAFTATRENIGIDYARKKYAHEPVADYWVAVARMVTEDLIMRPGRLPRTPPIIQEGCSTSIPSRRVPKHQAQSSSLFLARFCDIVK